MQAATDWGAKFYFSKEVESILTEGDAVKGIKLRNGGTVNDEGVDNTGGVVYADIVIANADLPMFTRICFRWGRQREGLPERSTLALLWCFTGELRQSARSSVLRRLHEAGLADIEEHIRFELSFLPTTFESYCNVTHGSVFGSLSHSLFQMGYFRPHNRHRKYKNLYFAGGSTHPGNGIPLVLLSAKLTSVMSHLI